MSRKTASDYLHLLLIGICVITIGLYARDRYTHTADRERYQLALDSAQVGSWIWGLDPQNLWECDGGTLKWDARMLEIYGLTAETFDECYEDWMARVVPEDRAQVDATIRKALEDNGRYEAQFEILTPTGERRKIHAYGKVSENRQRMAGINILIQ